jgi:hypothetical protein
VGLYTTDPGMTPYAMLQVSIDDFAESFSQYAMVKNGKTYVQVSQTRLMIIASLINQSSNP